MKSLQKGAKGNQLIGKISGIFQEKHTCGYDILPISQNHLNRRFIKNIHQLDICNISIHAFG